MRAVRVRRMHVRAQLRSGAAARRRRRRHKPPTQQTHVVRLDRAEGEVLGGDAHLGERVEERALADVGHADDAHLFGVVAARESKVVGAWGESAHTATGTASQLLEARRRATVI